MKKQTAKLSEVRIAPRKMRAVANIIRGMPVPEAEAQLLMNKRRPSGVLLKLLRSAKANAKQQELDPDQMMVSKIIVNEGPTLKRILPRARGIATPIHKKTSHVFIELAESEKAAAPRFTIIPPPKKEKSSKNKKIKKQTTNLKEVKKEENKKEKQKVGFFKRIFRRKSV